MNWKKIRRASGLIEWVCEHSVGHPDYESAEELDKDPRLKGSKGTWLIHGCDRCCFREDFPGKPKKGKFNKGVSF